MPAPSGSVIKGLILARLPSNYRNEQFDLYLTALCAEVSSDWAKWIKASSWGNCKVAGAGIGGWAGVGAGGKFIETGTIALNPEDVIRNAGFSSNSRFSRSAAQPQFKMILNLSSVLNSKFKSWSKSFVFAGVGYVGSSTATTNSPGTFKAANVPVPLLAAGVVPPFSGIASAFNSKLSSSEDGTPFQIDHKFCKMKEFTSAVGGGIEGAFKQIFLTTTMAAQNKVNGTASPGGVGSARSQSSGKLL